MARLILNWWVIYLTVTVYVMPAPLPREDLDTAIRLLRRYRYLPTGMDATEESVTSALLRFQQVNRLPETGELDEATARLMENPTCRDMDPSDTIRGLGHSRDRRYTIARGVKWDRLDVTYNVMNSPPTLEKSEVEQTFRRAFDSWQSICGLNFIARDSPDADIQIQFRQGYHGDRQGFDGPGGVLAHANTPYNNGFGMHGDIHLDIEETWVLTTGGTNLYQVALHEIGHTLALGHSDPDTVMHIFYPSYYVPGFRLQPDDIMAAQFLYGPNIPPVDEMDDPEVAMPDDSCVNEVDAITELFDGRVLAFTGRMVHYLMGKQTEARPEFPKTLVETFGGVMDSVTHVDAVIYWATFRKLFIFVGSDYYRYSVSETAPPETEFPKNPDPGYPRPIADDWRGIPSDIDAATTTPDGSVYIFKDDLIYKFGFYDRTYGVIPGYPKLMSTITTPSPGWSALSRVDIQAVMLGKDGYYYIISGDYYYRMDGGDESVLAGYPRSLSRDWFGCDILG